MFLNSDFPGSVSSYIYVMFQISLYIIEKLGFS